MADTDYPALIEAWLGSPQSGFRLVFPPVLEARYEADTRRERSQFLWRTGLVGCLTGVLLFPALCAALPDVARLCWRLYLETSLLIGFLVAVAMRSDPPPFLREAMQWLANVVNALVVAYLFAKSRATEHTLYAAGVITLLVYSTMGVPLRFRFALTAVAAILCAFVGGLAWQQGGGLGAPVSRDLVLLAVATGGFTLVANWRLELLQRRGYLLVLREQLRGESLSLRNRELDELVRRDALTGLANRRAYDSWLSALWQKAEGRGEPLGLIVLDVDRFKSYNDFYGHPGGDCCLQMVGRCLREQLRGTTDLVARLGGEEFAVLLPGLDAEICADVAERLREAVAGLDLPHLGLDSAGRVTVSAGVASMRAGPALRPADLFAAADTALYAAKEAGRNRICIADLGSGAGCGVYPGRSARVG